MWEPTVHPSGSPQVPLRQHRAAQDSLGQHRQPQDHRGQPRAAQKGTGRAEGREGAGNHRGLPVKAQEGERAYQSKATQTGPQPRALQLCAAMALIRSASISLFLDPRQATGAAPASSSSHRGQPGVLRPKEGPPQVCLVVLMFSRLQRLRWAQHPSDHRQSLLAFLIVLTGTHY